MIRAGEEMKIFIVFLLLLNLNPLNAQDDDNEKNRDIHGPITFSLNNKIHIGIENEYYYYSKYFLKKIIGEDTYVLIDELGLKFFHDSITKKFFEIQQIRQIRNLDSLKVQRTQFSIFLKTVLKDDNEFSYTFKKFKAKEFYYSDNNFSKEDYYLHPDQLFWAIESALFALQKRLNGAESTILNLPLIEFVETKNHILLFYDDYTIVFQINDSNLSILIINEDNKP